jgi:glycosyltransferase involved in cell wall biosynthesis
MKHQLHESIKNVIYISPFAHIGGAEKSLLIFLKYLDNRMFKPLLTCYVEGPLIKHARKLDIKTIIFKRDSFLSNFFLVWKIFIYIKQNRIDLVHVNSLDIRAGIAAWLAGVPLIGHLRVIFPFTWRDRLFVQLSNRTIAVSNAVVNAFCRRRSFVRDKFIVIPNATELPRNLTPAPLKQEFGLPTDAKLIGVVGRMDPWKGYEFFLESAAIIKKHWEKIFFFIVGDVVPGDSEGRLYLDILRRKTAELNLQDCLFFAGYREDILKVIKSLNVLVVPSIVLKKNRGKVTEGFGRVVIEAMAVEVPVVVSSVGGLEEIVEDKVSGILVNPGNPSAIAKAVLSILTDESKARKLGVAGQKRVKELFDVHNIMEKITELYFEVLNKGK